GRSQAHRAVGAKGFTSSPARPAQYPRRKRSEHQAMKRFLQISLLLNVVLLAAVGWRSRHEPLLPRPLRGEVSEALQNSARWQRSSPASRPQPSNAWSFIASAAPQQFIANLRAIGCPEQTIRDIVVM